MNEARANALGAAPLEPWFTGVDKMKSLSELQRTIARLHEVGVAVPFALEGNSDSHEPKNEGATPEAHSNMPQMCSD